MRRIMARGSRQYATKNNRVRSGPQPCGYCKNPGVEPFFGSLLPGGHEKKWGVEVNAGLNLVSCTCTLTLDQLLLTSLLTANVAIKTAPPTDKWEFSNQQLHFKWHVLDGSVTKLDGSITWTDGSVTWLDGSARQMDGLLQGQMGGGGGGLHGWMELQSWMNYWESPGFLNKSHTHKNLSFW